MIPSPRSPSGRRGGLRIPSAHRLLLVFLTGSILLVLFQQTRVSHYSPSYDMPDAVTALLLSGASSVVRSSSNIPIGRAVALPAIVPESTVESDAARFRQNVDGYGDPLHLGGKLDYDASTISPRVVELIRRDWGVKSMGDLGCGRGWSTSWFQLQGVNTICVEGSPAALKQTLLPSSSIVNHDFARGPWWPEETVDLLWSINFVQQVPRQYMRNYMAAMSKAAIL